MEEHRDLTEGHQRLEQAMARLAEAQVRTEAVLQQLARQCETLVCDIEEVAYIVLYDVLKREVGWEVGVLERAWQEWNGEVEEINVFGRATDPAQPERTIWIVGEAKHNLTLREVERFAQQAEHLWEEIPMRSRQGEGWSRREFLDGLTLAGIAGFLGLRPSSVAAEPPPETTTVKLTKTPSICRAPQWVAEELLSAEGFTDVKYVQVLAGGRGGDLTGALLVSGQVDLSMQFIGPSIIQVDAGDPIVLLAGVQIGCFELFGTDQVRAIRDLKGKTVAAGPLGGSGQTFLASMAAYVGLNPATDISWVDGPEPEALRLFAEGRVDAMLVGPPRAQEARARKLGYVVVSTMIDRPWSQYFCCLMAGHRDFVRRHPVATKRALRAILKATDVCAREPERVARFLVDEGYAERYDYALQALKDIPYSRWREYNPEDTVRFHALRLHEAGMIKSGPQKIIAQGTDWRFLNELKRELKG